MVMECLELNWSWKKVRSSQGAIIVDVPMTQMSIFVPFVGARVLFDSTFSLWVSLIMNPDSNEF